jgi:O-antigen/teichoic acid export membrane protein
MSVLYEKSFKYLLLVGTPLSIVLFMLGGDVINILYGAPYAPAALVLKIIALYVLLKFANFLFGTMLSSTDRQWERMKAQGVIALMSVVLSVILIDVRGAVGAAWAVVLTEIALFVVYFHYVNEIVPSLHLLKEVVKPAIAGGALVVCMAYLPLHFVLSTAIGLFIYGIALLMVGTFDDKDKEIFLGLYAGVQKKR